MNIFVTIKHVQDYEKVSYYSVCFEDEADSLFEQFIKVHQKKYESALYEMFRWIERIGNDIGAKHYYFRHEGTISDAKALPPPAKFLEIETENLRLYCMVANKNVVFLFNGSIKTTQKAQDCPNVAPHFYLANRLTKALTQCFIDKEIRWNENSNDIIFDDDFEFEI